MERHRIRHASAGGTIIETLQYNSECKTGCNRTENTSNTTAVQSSEQHNPPKNHTANMDDKTRRRNSSKHSIIVSCRDVRTRHLPSRRLSSCRDVRTRGLRQLLLLTVITQCVLIMNAAAQESIAGQSCVCRRPELLKIFRF